MVFFMSLLIYSCSSVFVSSLHFKLYVNNSLLPIIAEHCDQFIWLHSLKCHKMHKSFGKYCDLKLNFIFPNMWLQIIAIKQAFFLSYHNWILNIRPWIKLFSADLCWPDWNLVLVMHFWWTDLLLLVLIFLLAYLVFPSLLGR